MPDPEAQDVEIVHGHVRLGGIPAHAAENAPQWCQGAFGQEQAAEVAADETAALPVGRVANGSRVEAGGDRVVDWAGGVGEVHVEFEEEGGGAGEDWFGDVGFAADEGDAVRVEREVEDEPEAFDGVVGPGRAAEAFGRELDEDVFADALAPHHHLQPFETGRVAEVGAFGHEVELHFDALVLRFLAEDGVFDAEALVTAPGVDHVGIRRPCPHAGEDEGRWMTVEKHMKGLADAV